LAVLALNGGQATRTKPFPGWPVYGPEEHEALKKVLESGVWGVGGEEKKKIEEKFAAYQQARFGLTTTSGTTALEVSLRAMGIGCGDEVIVPAYTFMATATAILYVNAIPVFADIEPDTYNIDPANAESLVTEKTKGILPVHIGGRPADMDAVKAAAHEDGLFVLEDAAQAWGAEWRGKRVGAIGDMGVFSFQASKNMTSGEGGMIVTNNEDLYAKAWSLHNCGRLPEGEWYEHHLPGSNLRMTEFQAAVLQAQLARLDQQTETRMRNAAYLDRELSKVDGIMPLRRSQHITRHAYHLYIFRMIPESFAGASKDSLAKALQAEGIPASAGYSRPLYKEPYLEYFKRCPLSCPRYGRPMDYSQISLPVTERACYTEGLWLRQYVLLGTRDDMDDVVEAFHKVRDNAEELSAH